VIGDIWDEDFDEAMEAELNKISQTAMSSGKTIYAELTTRELCDKIAEVGLRRQLEEEEPKVSITNEQRVAKAREALKNFKEKVREVETQLEYDKRVHLECLNCTHYDVYSSYCRNPVLLSMNRHGTLQGGIAYQRMRADQNSEGICGPDAILWEKLTLRDRLLGNWSGPKIFTMIILLIILGFLLSIGLFPEHVVK
jgi:hypothetical protein